LAVGTPVVASQVDGIVDIVRDGVDGFLVLPDDPDVLAERIVMMLSDPELRDRMGANGRQRFLSCFEQRTIIRKQIQWFEGIVSIRKNKG
jgi:glycosyltransferase involved in cell wall biosynthesis